MFITILRYTKIITLAGIFLAHSGLALCSPWDVDIGTRGTKATKGKIKISVSRFNPSNDKTKEEFNPKELKDILKNDLFITGRFSASDGGNEKEKNDLEFLKLFSRGIEYAVLVNYAVKGKEFIFYGELFNTRYKDRVFKKKKYRGSKSTHRAIVHQFAADIIKTLTGMDSISDTKITFVSRKSGHKEVYTADFDGHNLQQITTDKSIALLPRWSPDRKRLVYTSYRDGRPELFTVGANGGRPEKLFESTFSNTGGSWSPDGNYLALTVIKKGNADIYIYDEKKNKLNKLTNSWAIDTSASWSPNGRQVVFTSDRSGKPQVYRVDRDGTNLKRLTYEGKYNDSAVWSPSGDRIAYISLADGKFNIYTMRWDGSSRKRLTYNDGSNESPSWSPDGNYIVFSSKRRGRTGIYMMRNDGEYEKLLVDIKSDCENPNWSR